MKYRAAFAVTVLASTVPAMAQEEPRNLDGVPSDIRAYSGQLEGGSASFTISVEGGTSVQVDAVPAPLSELDPVLEIVDVASGEVLANDDDGGEGLAARARVFSQSPRRLKIDVSTFEGGSSDGKFELYIRSSDYRPVEPRTITFRSTEIGTLASGDAHQFYFTGTEGTLLEVAMVADGEMLDPYLEIYEGRGASGEALATDDDGGDEVNALLRYVLPEDGTYTVIAKDFADGEGGYTLRVGEEKERVIQPPAQSIGIGDEVSGSIGTGYGGATGDPSMISYRLDEATIAAIRAGRGKLTFDMVAVPGDDPDFAGNLDPMLELGFETPLGFIAAESDDDGGEGLNSRLAIDLSPLAGENGWLERIEIHATSLAEETGPYTLTLREGLLRTVDDDSDADEEFDPDEEGWKADLEAGLEALGDAIQDSEN